MVLDRLARIEGILNDQTIRLSQLQIHDNVSPNQMSTSPFSTMDTTSSATFSVERPHHGLRPKLSTLNVPPGGHTSIDTMFSLPVILNLLPYSHDKVRRQSYLIQTDLEDTL